MPSTRSSARPASRRRSPAARCSSSGRARRRRGDARRQGRPLGGQRHQTAVVVTAMSRFRVLAAVRGRVAATTAAPAAAQDGGIPVESELVRSQVRQLPHRGQGDAHDAHLLPARHAGELGADHQADGHAEQGRARTGGRPRDPEIPRRSQRARPGRGEDGRQRGRAPARRLRLSRRQGHRGSLRLLPRRLPRRQRTADEG